ncbi:MAG: hypothetical protein ABEJ31_02140 [Haloarculaceae archaeon]
MIPWTRRRLLASVGLAGAAVGSGAVTAMGAGAPLSYTSYADAQTADPDARVTVAWQETYNGTVLETQAGPGDGGATATLDPAREPRYVPSAGGPVVTLGDVLPGDDGRLAVGVNVESVPETADGIDVWISLDLSSDAENGVTEPEAAAGDRAGDGGELADALAVTVWDDRGVGGLGARDGRLSQFPVDGALQLEPVLAEGSLRAAADALAPGQQLGHSCLTAGEGAALGFEWALPPDVGDAVQSDAAGFDVTVAAVACGTANPFDGGADA